MTLPDHLWLEITAHLSSTDVWNLLGVNRVLSDVALNHHYRTWVIDLDYPHDPLVIVRLRRLLHHTQRVRHLIFRPGTGQRPPLAASNSPWATLQCLWHGWSPTVAHEVLLIIGSLPNVSTVHVDCGRERQQHQAFKNATHLLAQALTTLSKTLTTLHVRTLVCNIPHLFPRHLQLKTLSELRVTMIHRHARDDAFSDKTLADFVNRHRFTLEGIDFKLQNIRYDLSPLLSSLEILPTLRHFTYYITPIADRTSVTRFFHTQAATIRSLTIYAHLSSELADTLFGELINTQFPELNRLEIDLGIQGVRLTTPRSLEFLHNVSQTLSILDLAECSLTDDQCELLISRLGPSTSLVHLGIRPTIVTPNLVSALATQFRSLDSLNLHASNFRGTVASGNVTSETTEFCSEIKFRYLSRWNLRHLTLPTDAFHTYHHRSCVIALVASIPSLITVNNSVRKPTARSYRGIEYRVRA